MNTCLEHFSSVYPGVIVAENFTWNSHIDHLSDKANKILGFTKRNCTRDMSCKDHQKPQNYLLSGAPVVIPSLFS